jgi:aminoglycoside 3-N-acetyltransferase I
MAYALALTRTETTELFIYDVAVRPDRQRRGVGRALWTALLAEASAAGIAVMFVPAETADVHAIEFYRALGGTPTPVTMFTFAAAEEKQSG